MKENSEVLDHIFSTQINRIDFEVGIDDMLLDLKALLQEYYCGTFTYDEKSIKISLNNGQKFLLKLTAI